MYMFKPYFFQQNVTKMPYMPFQPNQNYELNLKKYVLILPVLDLFARAVKVQLSLHI